MTDPLLLKPCVATGCARRLRRQARAVERGTALLFALLVAVAPDRVLAGTVTSTASLSPNEARLYEATVALAAGDAERAEKLLAQSTVALDDYRALTRAK